MVGLFFMAGAENDNVTRHIRRSAGLGGLVGRSADKAHRVEVGRACARFALQATALGVRTAHLNQPIEVPALRPRFAGFLGIGSMRPDLVLRFGRGPPLPPSPGARCGRCRPERGPAAPEKGLHAWRGLEQDSTRQRCTPPHPAWRGGRQMHAIRSATVPQDPRHG
jgi:hypothetical protein